MEPNDAADRHGRWIGPVAAGAGRQLRRAGRYAISDTVRLAVTGLARSGKTVLTAALVQNLLLARSRPTLMPFFAAAHEGRLIDVRRLPPRKRASFPFDQIIASLSQDRPAWPPSTTGISELRLTIEYRPRGAAARLLSEHAAVTLAIIDYPGEWLLDLPLLERSYETWSAEMLDQARSQPRARLSTAFVGALDGLDTGQRAEEGTIERLSALYTDYLRACRAPGVGLSFVQPGRFLLPGDGRADPRLLRFAPLPPRTGPAPGGSLFAAMAERFEGYKRALVEPFFREHFRRFDRQLVLIDVLSALEAGYEAFLDAERALSQVLGVYRYGRSTLFARLFGSRIDKVLFAATKADHITPNQYNNLRALLEAMAKREERFPGLAEDGGLSFGLVAALKCTEPAMLRFQGRPVEALRGVPVGASEPQVLYPGEIPAHYPVPQDWAEGRFRFVDFAPPPAVDPRREGVRGIYLDKALDFLIGDKFW